MSHPIGIDLGTSFSAIAYLQPDGTPDLISNHEGERLTPSIVHFSHHPHQCVVGTPAKKLHDSIRTVHGVKKHMDDPDFHIDVDSESWTAPEIAAILLRKLKHDAEKVIGSVGEAVITVPANYNELARRSTLAAAQMAGIQVKQLVNEPTAAALYYAYLVGSQGNILVFDFGGGTLDITILRLTDYIEILTSEGARHLGGNDIDQLLLDLYDQPLEGSSATDLKEAENLIALEILEKAKRQLSESEQAEEYLPTAQGNLKLQVDRQTFDHAISRLMTRAAMLVEQALDSAHLNAEQIDHIVMVGGSSRIPRVHNMLERLFGKPPSYCGNVDEAVALGAALFTQYASSVQDVCNHSYGTLANLVNRETGESQLVNSIIIAKNTPIPCAYLDVFYTSQDQEPFLQIDITQGEDSDPRYVDIIGTAQLKLPPNRPAGSPIEVIFSYDENQCVRVTLRDRESGKETSSNISYTGKGTLSDTELHQRRSKLNKQQVA